MSRPYPESERTHAHHRWYVAASAVMAVSFSVFHIALNAWPELLADWLLPAGVVVVALLALLQWRGGRASARVAAQELRALWLSLALAIVPMTISRLLLPEGFSPWLLVLGLLPGVPFAVLAWRVSRS